MSAAATSSLLVALQHADSQFPSGGFAFSQGLEASSLKSAQLGGFDLACFLDVQLRHRWASSDRVAVLRAHRQDGDLARIAHIDHELEASTFVSGLREGSKRNGAALLTAHSRIGTAGASDYRSFVQRGEAPGHLAVVQGLVWKAVGLDEASAVAMSGYQLSASLTTAAVRLGLVGAIEAQALLQRCLAAVADVSERTVTDDEPFRSFTPLSEIAVCRHGSDGQRLFFN